MRNHPLIKVNNLNVIYFKGQANEVRALNNINLKIYHGEFIIFFGPSGCGKSTLLYSIAGLERDISGNIYIDGVDMAKFNNQKLELFHQKQIGMIFQAYYLINSLNVLKNVILPQISIREKITIRKEKALKLLKHFGVNEQINKFPNELSGGQQQRVAICRSLINDPDILLADEPIGNLDSSSAEDVMNLIKDLNNKQKKTIILVTHNPAYLDIAHRVFYMKDGVIINVKVNKAINEDIKLSSYAEEKQVFSISKDLELLARTFSSITGSTGNLLIPFKSKQIVAEALTNMTSEEINKIEKKVENLLLTGVNNDDEEMFNYLDKEIDKGGLGLNKQTALNLAKKLKDIVIEIKSLEEEEKNMKFKGGLDLSQEVDQIRDHLLLAFNIEIKDDVILNVINNAIQDRLENKIEKKIFQKQLDLPVKKGGAGMDRRTARKLAKRLELLILGKYK